jgi:hypothetical protein
MMGLEGTREILLYVSSVSFRGFWLTLDVEAGWTSA